MYMELLEQIVAARGKFYENSAQPTCSEAEIDRTKKSADKKFGAKIPEDLIELWKKTAGISWNNVTIYSCKKTPLSGEEGVYIPGIVEANIEWREDESLVAYLIIGESDIRVFALEVESGNFMTLDRIDGFSEEKRFSSCAEMFEFAFKKALR